MTPLQTWLITARDLLDDARAQLDAREFETFMDIVATMLAREYVRLLLRDDLDWEQAA